MADASEMSQMMDRIGGLLIERDIAAIVEYSKGLNFEDMQTGMIACSLRCLYPARHVIAEWPAIVEAARIEIRSRDQGDESILRGL